MILYISNEENGELLDDLVEQKDWQLLKVHESQISLNSFIAQKMPVLQELQYLVLERACILESDKELTDVIDMIHSVWVDAHVILLEEKILDDDGNELEFSEEQGTTLLNISKGDILTKLTYILNGKKIPQEDTGVWIGIMSANSGAGATHMAINLTNYIYQYNKSVCYVEANESGDLLAMADYYEFHKVEDNHYEKDGIDYWHQSIDPGKEFVVIDLGKYSSNKLSLFRQCKVKIVISDGKPYRMNDANSVLKYIGDTSTKLYLNFITEKDFMKLKTFYDLPEQSSRLAWHPDMFDGVGSSYAELLRDYISIPEKKTKFIIGSEKVKELIGKKSNRQLKTNPEDYHKIVVGDIHTGKSRDLVQVEEKDINLYEETDHTESGSHEDNEMVMEADDDSIIAKKKKKIKTLLPVIAVLCGIAAYASWPQLHNFLFHNHPQPATTELVDENLNINPDIKISVLEVEGADGYEVSYSTDKSFPTEKTVVVEVQTADKAVENLAANKTYYVRVRAFKYNEDGLKVYGDYTDVQKIDT